MEGHFRALVESVAGIRCAAPFTFNVICRSGCSHCFWVGLYPLVTKNVDACVTGLNETFSFLSVLWVFHPTAAHHSSKFRGRVFQQPTFSEFRGRVLDSSLLPYISGGDLSLTAVRLLGIQGGVSLTAVHIL